MQRAFDFARHVETGAPAPSATITVRNAGTLTISTIFSDNGITPKANPFTADATTAYWSFYASSAVNYDVTISGTDAHAVPITTYTLGDITLGGVFSLNGLVTNPQVFATSTTGTDFAIVSSGSTHTFGLPSASETARGLVTTGAQTFGGLKTFATPIGVISGGTGLAATPVNGSLLIGRTSDSSFVQAFLTGTTNQIVVTNTAGAVTLSTPQDINTTAEVVFDGLSLADVTASSAVLTNGANKLFGRTLTNGQLLVGSTGLSPVAATLTAGANVTITNAAGAITIASAGGIISLNGLTTATQTFSPGSSGTDFTISSVGSTHTFNLPNASTTARGLVNITTQTFNGTKTFNDPMVFLAGASTTGSAIVSGVVSTNVTPVVTTTTGEDDLMTYSLPADVLNVAGKAVRITAWGDTDAAAGSKNLKVYFGTSLASKATNNSKANEWYITATISRITNTTQTSVAFISSDAGDFTVPLTHTGIGAPGQTLSGVVAIKITGTAAAGIITQKGMIVEVVG